MSIKLEDVYSLAKPFVLLADKSPGAERLATELSFRILKMRHNNRNDIIRVVRGDKSRTKQDFANEVSAALQFPQEFFGRSWDAFNEFMNDLDWLPPTDSYLLVITNADQLLLKEPLKDLEILMGILNSTAKTGSRV